MGNELTLGKNRMIPRPKVIPPTDCRFLLTDNQRAQAHIIAGIVASERLADQPRTTVDQAMSEQKNVQGGPLEPCSLDPMTGFYRTGACRVGPEDRGCHAVCSVLTADFLAFSKAAGNDLSTPHPEWGFPGLKPGQRWCLCAGRWKEAWDAGHAPQVILEATHEAALNYVTRSVLEEHAFIEADNS